MDLDPAMIAGAVAAVAVVAGVAFCAWVATSDSREARTYRRKWSEFKRKYTKRDTKKCEGVGAGGGSSARDRRVG